MPYRPLLNKLKSFEVTCHILRWVADYLTSRSHCVVVKGDKSDIAHVKYFLTSLRDLFWDLCCSSSIIDETTSIPLSSGNSQVMYADDVCIYRPISSCSDFRYVQKDVEAVEEWSTENSSSFQPI